MSKAKIYELWHGDYDGNSSWQFTHPNGKLRAEFEQDCQDVLREFAPDFIAKESCWIGTCDLLRVIADNLSSRGYVLFDKTFETVSFGMGGSSILRRKEQSSDEEIHKLMGADVSELVYKKNDKIQRKLNRKDEN